MGYALAGLVYPAAGPTPNVAPVYDGIGLTYDPIGLAGYTWLSAPGAIAFAASVA